MPIDAQRELQIDEREYDVSAWIKKHPGGSIIKFQLGTDATDAFHAFHVRSKKASKILESLPSRPADSGTADPLTADFRALRSQLVAEGFFEPDPAHIAYRLAELLVMHAVGVALVWAGWVATGILVLGIAQGRCGWLQHEGGHYSLTGNIAWDRHVQMFSYGLGCGMSGCYWRNQHNKHHAAPQKLRHDTDLDTLPLIAFNQQVAKRGNKQWLSVQAPLFFSGLITLLVAFVWQFFQHPRHSLRVKNFVECGYYALRLVVWHALFGYLGVGRSIGLYCAYVGVAAAYIFINFAVSHTHKDVVPADQHLSWALYSANHTTNCSPGWACNWWMAYLNFQIEHHLFPSMPQYRHARIAGRVQAMFKKHGVEYDVRPYWTCMAATFANLWQVGHPKQH